MQTRPDQVNQFKAHNVISRNRSIPVSLPNDQTVYVDAQILDPEQEVALLDQDFSVLVRAIDGIATAFARGIQSAAPDSAQIEISIAAGIEAGQLVALIAKATTASTFKVTLQWKSLNKPQGSGTDLK